MSKMLRTRFKKQIVCQFLPPQRRHSRDKVIILAKGMPGAPKNPETMEFWSKKGFWVFLPSYRGTWESDGRFLARSPHEDIMDIIDELSAKKSVTDLWSGQSHKLSVVGSGFFIIGGSFGGGSAILASHHKKVAGGIAISPVIDWTKDSTDEPLDKLGKFLRQGFGNAYRFSSAHWKKLSQGKIYNPIKEMDSIEGEKILILHAKDDRVVPYAPSRIFAEKTGAKLITFPRGGHFGISESTDLKFYKHIKKFMRSR
ncbi:MAG: prolyl oligopeptidase family serine peptidase [bacterium]|nr:prolyl oligopeptidase family serine peptidase [bacterium]